MIKITRESNRILIDLQKHDRHLRSGIRKALHEIGQEVVKEDQRLITEGPKTGRIYRIKGRDHQASAPGEAPANLSGKLRESADYKVHSEHKMEVGEYAGYAGYLETGTSKMEPRPHLIKAVDNNQREALRALEEYPKEEMGA